MFLYYLIIILLWPVALIMTPAKVINRKNIPKKGRAIFAVTHHSNWDPIGMIFWVPRYQRFMAKVEVSRFFFLRWVIQGIGSFFVDRGKPNLKAYKKCIGYLKKDQVVTIFPQGTRKEFSESENELKNGVAVFAYKTNSPIVPIIILNKQKPFRFNKYIVGEPFTLEPCEKPKKEQLEAASKLLSEQLLKTQNDYEAKIEQKKNKKKAA